MPWVWNPPKRIEWETGKFDQFRRRLILSENFTFYAGSFRVGPFCNLTRGFSLSTVKRV